MPRPSCEDCKHYERNHHILILMQYLIIGVKDAMLRLYGVRLIVNGIYLKHATLITTLKNLIKFVKNVKEEI